MIELGYSLSGAVDVVEGTQCKQLHAVHPAQTYQPSYVTSAGEPNLWQ
jgi:hypothetical protein